MIAYKSNAESVAPDPVKGDCPPWPVYVVASNADMADALAKIRRARGMTCEELDARAGFSDRYTAKLEHADKPSGRKALRLSAMGEVWLHALGYRLLLVPADQVAAVYGVAA